MKKLFLFCSMACMLVCYSCSKTSDVKPPAKAPLVTTPGVPDGTATTKTIGIAGGSITSSDGKIKVEIPAGALPADQVITVQPITNKLEFGLGKAYRLTPHLSFSKPVTISFTYNDTEIMHTLPELLSIAYQDSTGGWRAMTEPQVDKEQKLVSVTTTHFSDWGFFPMIYIQPTDARVEPGKTLDLTVMGTVDPDDILVPLPGGTPITDPYEVPGTYLGTWHYSGAGNLKGKGGKAVYTAPAAVPENNPEAVSVEVKMKRPGYMLLVSNITVLSEFHIDYLQVDETEQANYGSRLVIYGNFGNDPGEGKRSVKIGGSLLNIMFWTPKVIVCEIYSAGPLSSGNVEVSTGTLTDSKILNEWLVELMYEKVESPGGALTKKVKFVLRIRGDANGYLKPDQQSLIPYTDLNKMSKAIITMPTGSYTSTVSGDGCGDYTVKWGALNEHVVDRLLYSTSHTGLRGRLLPTADGITLQLRFMSDDILKSTRIMDPCHGDRNENVVMEPISLAGYEDDEIRLRFSGSGTGASILAGAMPEIKRTGVASGLYFDAVNVNPDLYYTNMSWKEAQAKYR